MASRVGRWGATRRTTCTASSRSGTSTWIWAPQMCCSLTSTWYSCCMCANRAPAEMSPPSTSTSGTVPAATTPRPCGSAASASRARSRCRCARSSSRVSHTGVLVSTSDRCSSGANSSPSSWPRSASTSGVDRRVSRSTTWNSSSAPIWSSRLLMAATVGSVCYADVARGVTGRGCECTREAAHLPLKSHLRVGVRPVVRDEWRPERCADTAEFMGRQVMDAATLHPTAMIGSRSTRATSVSGSVDQALITGTDRGRAGRRGWRRILADLALCALRGAAFPRAAGLTSCGCC